MPSVAEELAELRKSSITKNFAGKLKDADGLSTPEQEAQAIKNKQQQTHQSNYTKAAVQSLNAGTKAVDQDLDFKVQQIAKKKEDKKKQREAAQTNNAGTKAVDKTLEFERQKMAQKKQDVQKQKEATQTNNAGTKAVDKTMDFEVQKMAQKKEDQEKQKEATENLQNFKGTAATPTTSTPAAASATKQSKIDDSIPVLEDVPELEEQLESMVEVPQITPSQQQVAMAPPPPRVQNRAEKKARKVMERLGMKAVPGIGRVTIKMRGSQGYFTIHQPDVFEKNGSYTVFGEARQGSGMPQQQQQAQAVQQLDTPVALEEKKAVEPAQVEEEVVDYSGLEAKDIDLVISQAGCSRAKAVAALKDNSGDLVNAIMSLTT